MTDYFFPMYFQRIEVVPFSAAYNKNISCPDYSRPMSQELNNPFTSSRVSIPTSTSLLTYGEDSISFFSRLQNSNRPHRSHTTILTQRETEQRIINRFEKEMYTMDESGHCLAESAIDDILTQDGEKEQDFWEKIKVLKPKKQLSNPFTTKIENDNIAKKTTLSEKPIVLAIRRSQEIAIPKTSRHSSRLEMIKFKDIIKKERLKQEKTQGKVEKFSLVNMYKNKRQSQPSIPSMLKFQETKTESLKTIARYPESIKLNNITYQKIELLN